MRSYYIEIHIFLTVISCSLSFSVQSLICFVMESYSHPLQIHNVECETTAVHLNCHLVSQNVIVTSENVPLDVQHLLFLKIKDPSLVGWIFGSQHDRRS